MAIICRDLKLLYIMVGSTGCTSTGKILREKFKGEWLPKERIGNLDRKHNSIRQLLKYGLISREELGSYLKVANIRNPFDRVVTRYERFRGPTFEEIMKKPGNWIDRRWISTILFKREIKLARKLNFDQWVKSRHSLYRRARSWILYFFRQNFPLGRDQLYWTEGVDRYIRYESLEKDFNKILKELGVKERVSIPNVNPTKGKKNYKEYYSEESKAIIAKVFKKELDKFGYTFEGPKEETRRKS